MMSTSIKVLTTICLCLILSTAQSNGTCRQYELSTQSATENYNPASSILNMPYWGTPVAGDPLANKAGWQDGIAGINENGTIFYTGGRLGYDFNEPSSPNYASSITLNAHLLRINVYESMISYDDTTEQQWEPWMQNNFSFTWGFRPSIVPPSTIPNTALAYYELPPNQAPYGQGAIGCEAQCATSLGDNYLYIVNFRVRSGGSGQYLSAFDNAFYRNWPMMIVMEMDDKDPRWRDDMASYLPNNAYADLSAHSSPYTDEFDIVRVRGDGCTTNNGTHIFHFNWAYMNDSNSFQTTFIYDVETKEWSLGSGNTEYDDKWYFGCASDGDGEYIYLIAGHSTTDGEVIETELPTPSLSTDRYNTRTDTWERLPSTADYPEHFSRMNPKVVYDGTTNQLLVFGGSIINTEYEALNDQGIDLDPDQIYAQQLDGRKVEIFDLDTLTWIINEDIADDLYLESEVTYGAAAVVVKDFRPNGVFSNESADTLFFMGGKNREGSFFYNDISFLSILPDRELYVKPVTIQMDRDGGSTSLDDITTFDAHQRLELEFRIVFTEDAPELWDTTNTSEWRIEFEIDGKSLPEVNDMYNTQLMTRDGLCICYNTLDNPCVGMPENVKQVLHVQLLIPSRRDANSGWCVDDSQEWIFSENTISNITASVYNNDNELVGQDDIPLRFAAIELMSQEVADQSILDPITRGCYINQASNGVFTDFSIQCDGFQCLGCVEVEGIDREVGDFRPDQLIEYNVLMDDVLLSPDSWATQGFGDAITGTASFDPSSLLVVVRSFTTVGSYYTKCFENGVIFEGDTTFFNMSDDWTTYDTAAVDYTAVIEKLNSENTTDVVAAFNVLKTMKDEGSIPDTVDPKEDITKVVQDIINTDTDNKDDTTVIQNDIALINLLTSDSDWVDPDTAVNISGEWIPDQLDKVLELAGDDPDADQADTIQTIGAIANEAATNVLAAVNNSNLTEAVIQETIQNVQEIVEKQLEGAWTNEVIITSRNGVDIKGEIIDPSKGDKCEWREKGIGLEFPPPPAQELFKCVVGQGSNDEVPVDLFRLDGTRVFQTNDSCVPFLISMNIPSKYVEQTWQDLYNGEETNWWNTSGRSYPSCTFYDPEKAGYDTEGCWVHEVLTDRERDSDTITCACTHLTTFKISAEHFDPKANLLTVDDINQVNSENIQNHPITWVTMLMIVVVLAVACICVPNNNADKPIIAFEDIIYKEFRDQYLHKHQQWHEIQQIDRWYSKIAQTKREMSISGQGHEDDGLNGSPLFNSIHGTSSPSSRKLTGGRKKKRKQGKYYCLLSANLFKTYLKNDHTVLSVFQRTDGTNFSTKQRIGLFLLYMYFIMMADAIFYAQERHPMGEIFASALISLIGTFPVYLVRVLFQWSKPRVVKSAKSRNGSFHEPLMNDVSSASQDVMPQDVKPVIPTTISVEMGENTDSNRKQRGIDLITPSDNTAITPYTPAQGIHGQYNQTVITPEENSNAASMASSLVSKADQEDSNDESYDDELKDEEYLKKTGQMHDTNMNRRLSNTYWSAIAELKKTSRPDMKLVRKCMHYVNTKANASEKASLASEIRLILFNYNYPFPHWYKKMAWTILVIACIICIWISVTFGIQFDIRAAQDQAARDNLNIVANETQSVIEENAAFCNLSKKLNGTIKALSLQQIDLIQERQQYADDAEINNDFKFAEYDSTKWLLNVLISFLCSVFIWQPLSIYILTWLKVWAFHNGLIMEASVYNIWLFLCCCCYSQKKKSISKQKSMLEFSNKRSMGSANDLQTDEYDEDGKKGKKPKVSYVPEDSQVYELSVSGSGFAAVGNEDRALDVIGFLCNDELFVELPDDFESSYTH